MVDAADRTKQATKLWPSYEDPPAETLVRKRPPVTPVTSQPSSWAEGRVATSPAAQAASSTLGMDKTFTDSKSLANEILRLQGELAKPNHDPAMRMQLVMRQAEWVQKAKAEGFKEPQAALDPVNATPSQIASAVVWHEIGGVTPRSELERDGGRSYLTSIRDAVTRQTAGFQAMVDLHSAHPSEQKDLLKRELARLGAATPQGAQGGDPSVDDLETAVRNANLALTGKQLVADANEQRRRKYIGLDGRVGTEEQVVRYERNEALAAMYPGTTSGSLAATAPNVASRLVRPSAAPPDVPQMRGLGQLGDAAEGALGHYAPPMDTPKNQHQCTYTYPPPEPTSDASGATGP